MNYSTAATSKTPALIIYLLDVSASMEQPLGNRRRIDVVTEALQATMQQMIFRSTKGRMISPRYRVAILAYSDHVYDLTDGVKTITEVAQLGVPQLNAESLTCTAKAFSQVEKLLQSELPHIQHCPAPLVCHMTDGEYTDEVDPEPIVRRIMSLSVPDGPVLVENIYLSDQLPPITNPKQWTGITPQTRLANQYAEKLKAMSSPLPASYSHLMYENGYKLDKNAVMFLPGTSSELVALGFVMSAATPMVENPR